MQRQLMMHIGGEPAEPESGRWLDSFNPYTAVLKKAVPYDPWLESPDVHCIIIPGMRRIAHVRSNIAVGDGRRLPVPLMEELRRHRWDRTPTEWSQ